MSAEPERIADVVELGLARARDSELASSFSPSEKDQLASSAAHAFAKLVRQVEQLDRGPLGGRGRDECAAAFESHPAGFVAAVDEAVTANVRSHRGLLVSLVRDGWHVVADTLAEDMAAARRNRCGCLHHECRFQDICLEEVEG